MLQAPGACTPIEMAQVTADLYGVCVVVCSIGTPEDAKLVYGISVRGSYNARHIFYTYVRSSPMAWSRGRGDRGADMVTVLQPLPAYRCPNDYYSTEFRLPHVTLESTMAYGFTTFSLDQRNEGMRHPWRGEFPGESLSGPIYSRPCPTHHHVWRAAGFGDVVPLPPAPRQGAETYGASRHAVSDINAMVHPITVGALRPLNALIAKGKLGLDDPDTIQTRQDLQAGTKAQIMKRLSKSSLMELVLFLQELGPIKKGKKKERKAEWERADDDTYGLVF